MGKGTCLGIYTWTSWQKSSLTLLGLNTTLISTTPLGSIYPSFGIKENTSNPDSFLMPSELTCNLNLVGKALSFLSWIWRELRSPAIKHPMSSSPDEGVRLRLDLIPLPFKQRLASLLLECTISFCRNCLSSSGLNSTNTFWELSCDKVFRVLMTLNPDQIGSGVFQISVVSLRLVKITDFKTLLPTGTSPKSITFSLRINVFSTEVVDILRILTSAEASGFSFCLKQMGISHSKYSTPLNREYLPPSILMYSSMVLTSSSQSVALVLCLRMRLVSLSSTGILGPSGFLSCSKLRFLKKDLYSMQMLVVSRGPSTLTRGLIDRPHTFYGGKKISNMRG